MVSKLPAKVAVTTLHKQEASSNFYLRTHRHNRIFLCTINYRERIELKFLNMIDNTFNKIIVEGT